MAMEARRLLLAAAGLGPGVGAGLGPLVAGPGGDAGGQVLPLHAGQGPGPLHQLGGGAAPGDDPHLRAVGAQVADQPPGVDADQADHAVALQVGVEPLLGAEAGGHLGVVPGDEGGGVDPVRLVVGGGAAVVPRSG